MSSQDFLISTGCIIMTCGFSQITRNYLQKQFSGGLFGIMTMEFVAMFELCAICYEFGIIMEFYGMAMYSIFLFTICLWRSFYWRNVNACPYSYIEDWFIGKYHISFVLTIILVQLLGGSIVYNYYSQIIWSYELSEKHKGRMMEDVLTSCTSDVRVFPIYAALTEGFAVFVCCMTYKIFSTITNSTICNIITSFVVTCLVVGALGISGGYLNPALASVLQHGCSGSTLLEQFLVYWVSNTTGAMLAYYFWNYVQLYSILKVNTGDADVTQKLKRG